MLYSCKQDICAPEYNGPLGRPVFRLFTIVHYSCVIFACFIVASCIFSFFTFFMLHFFPCYTFLMLKKIEHERNAENTIKKRPYTQRCELVSLLF